MYSHFTFLSVCHLMTCYDDRFGSSHKRSDCRHLLLFHGIQLLTAVSSMILEHVSSNKLLFLFLKAGMASVHGIPSCSSAKTSGLLMLFGAE